MLFPVSLEWRRVSLLAHSLPQLLIIKSCLRLVAIFLHGLRPLLVVRLLQSLVTITLQHCNNRRLLDGSITNGMVASHLSVNRSRPNARSAAHPGHPRRGCASRRQSLCERARPRRTDPRDSRMAFSLHTFGLH